jgi:hypothetical protein
MAIVPTLSPLPSETVRQLRLILERLFREGRQWVRGIGTTDWRRTQYVANSRAARDAVGTVPSVANVVVDIQVLLAYLGESASNESALTHNYIVVKADSKCLDSNGIALLRPVLKTNFDNEPQLNFHVWFHCLSPGTVADHLMVGWRLEAPEGGGSAHDFFHAQPLRRYGPDAAVHGLHSRFPESFPTIPLPATNLVELCLTAVLVACGKDALRALVRGSGDAKVRAAANAYWTKVFGASSPPADVVALSGA